MPYSKYSYSCCKVQGCFFWCGDIKCYHIVSISRFCIQTNNILFVANDSKLSAYSIRSKQKKLPGNHLSGSFFVVCYLRMSAQRASILEMYFSTSLYSIELG